jgi:hypothetical protein
METRARPQSADSSWDWIDMALNALLVGILLVAIVAIVRQMQSPPTLGPSPTYTRPIV